MAAAMTLSQHLGFLMPGPHLAFVRGVATLHTASLAAPALRAPELQPLVGSCRLAHGLLHQRTGLLRQLHARLAVIVILVLPTPDFLQLMLQQVLGGNHCGASDQGRLQLGRHKCQAP